MPAIPATTSTVPHDAKRSRRRRIFFALLTTSLVVGGYFAAWRYHLKRFQIVESGVLLRSAQPTEFGLWYLKHRYGLKTVVSLQLHDFRLYHGWFDFGSADGEPEASYAESIGLRHVQWPMGDEQGWPWPDAWELEEFFHLVDDAEARPILVHCMGGRHRTGTLSALYRLEYDRWSPDAAIAEMHTFQFGGSIPLQEHNLRSYLPRPLPNAEAWAEIARRFDVDSSEPPAKAFPVLAARIRRDAPGGPLRKAWGEYLNQGDDFAVPFATWVAVRPGDEVSPSVLARAEALLSDERAEASLTSAAAGLIADFGSTAARRNLLHTLTQGSHTAEPTPHYEALVAGVTNRYTANRTAYLRPLLEDRRKRIGVETARFTYSDTAVYRFAAITNELPVWTSSPEQLLTEGRTTALARLSADSALREPGPLVPPHGRRTAYQGEGSAEEDLSKMRR